MITSLVAYVALPIIMLLALGSSIGDFEPSMISPNILAAPRCMTRTGDELPPQSHTGNQTVW